MLDYSHDLCAVCVAWAVRDELSELWISTSVLFFVLLPLVNNMLFGVNFFNICMLNIIT